MLASYVECNLQNAKFLPNQELEVFPQSMTECAHSVRTFKPFSHIAVTNIQKAL